MSLTLLFDLDDTLIDTNLDAFIPAYFQALGRHMSSRVAPNRLLPALISGTNLMYESEDPTHTLEEIFDSKFYEGLGIPKEELVEVIDDFYENVFPTLESQTTPRQEAASLIQWAASCGFRVAIATD